MEMEKLNKLSEIFKEVLEKYELSDRALIYETSMNIKKSEKELDDEISKLKAEWAIAMCEVKND